MIALLLAQVLAQATQPGHESNALVFGFILLGAAVLLLGIELFVPSGGLIGALAAVAAIGSVVAFYMYDTTWGVVATLSYLLLGPILIVFGFRLWLHSPMARSVILGGVTGVEGEEGDSPSPMSAEHARQERNAQLRQLIGVQGVAVTPLRPVGTVKINGQRVDALAENGVVDAGTPVVVTDVYDNQIKVRPA